MTAIWDFVFSPAGLAAYAAFWAFKLLAGAWILRKTLSLLPVPVQTWTEDRLSRLKLRRRVARH